MTDELPAKKADDAALAKSGWLVRFLYFLWNLPRSYKRLLQASTDSLILVVGYLLAMFFRYDHWDFLSTPSAWYAIAVTAPLTLVAYWRLGLYRAMVRFLSVQVLKTMMYGALFSGALLLIVSQTFKWSVPRSVPYIYALLVFCAIAAGRLLLQAAYLRLNAKRKVRAIIYGAGNSGRQLCSSLLEGPEYQPVAFLDDDRDLHGSVVGGLQVYSPLDARHLIASHHVSLILLAIPSVKPSTRAEIISSLQNLPVQVRTIPGMADIVSGRASVSDLREVSVEELLGRDPVPPRPELMSAQIQDKNVLVSGAGGSIGSELCRQILSAKPRRLVLYELSEVALYQIESELSELIRREGIGAELVSIIGSVQDEQRVRNTLRRFEVSTIYHAAAYKHVPMVEANVVAGVRNNVFGTRTLARAAVEAGVSDFILISTDKAVRPTNIMGATKRMAELVCQALAASGGPTRFSMVRFGNVLGSSGSVIPRFKAQLERGGPLTVTHRDITRYFMTIPEAAQLVIQAGAMAQGGDVFVLDMGKSIKILDLAVRIAQLAGRQPVIDGEPVGRIIPNSRSIEIVFSGLRPGEKLYEELLIAADSHSTDHPRIMSANEAFLSEPELEAIIAKLDGACAASDIEAVRQTLKSAPTGYDPYAEIVDPLAG